MNVLDADMSRRRLGYNVRKGYCRRQTIPYASVPECSTMLVHLPLVAYTSGKIPCASYLHRRLTEFNVLPDGWNASSVAQHDVMSPIDDDLGSGDYLTLYKLCIIPPFMCCTSSFMLTIAPNCTWILCIGRNMVNIEHCELVADSPGRLCSVDAVIGVLSTLDSCKFCVGNPDRKFIDLIQSDRHNGSIKDQSGKLQ
jgi:hypothetical protein